MSASPCVIAHATDPLNPKCGNPGSPGNVAPVTSKSGQVTRHCQYTFGVSSARCESLQITAPPCAVRRPLTAHALDPGSTSARNPRCPSMSPSASSSSRRPGASAARRAAPRPATRRPAGVSSRSNASAPARASSTAFASLCCHCPISTCRTRNAATECQASHGSTGYRAGQRQRPVRDRLVDPARVGLERGPYLRGHHRDVELGGGGEPEPPGEDVPAERRGARRSPPTARTPAAGRSPSGTAGPARTRTPSRPTRPPPSRPAHAAPRTRHA